MAKIQLSDLSGSAGIEIPDTSLAARKGLSELKAQAADVVTALSRPLLEKPFFKEAKFGAAFGAPIVNAGAAALAAKVSATAVLRVSRCADTPLFGKDDYDSVTIAGDECWLTFELDSASDVNAKVPLADGFGVCVDAANTPKFATHVRIPAAIAATMPLRYGLNQVLSAFCVLDSPDAVFAIPNDTICVNDVAGSVKVGGSWHLPLAVNQFCLADAKLPFGQCASVVPCVNVGVKGDVTLKSEFSVRVWRADPNSLHFGLYRKKDSCLDAAFTAAAGLDAKVAGTDLIQTIFTAAGPGIDTKVLSPDEAAKIHQVLKDSIDRSLSISLNAECAASFADEAMLVYAMDVSNVNQAQRDAVKRALLGDWGGFDDPAVARKLRDVIRETVERKTSLRLNFLGIYNAKSVADFVLDMKVLKNEVDGSVTITDKATASRISTSSTPLACEDDRLRKALSESFVATLTYKALMKGVGTDTAANATQSFLLYQEKMPARVASKQMNAAQVLGLLTANAKNALNATGGSVQHARFSGERTYGSDEVLRFFFSDVDQLTPRAAGELAAVAKETLAGLLDPSDPVDAARIAQLRNPDSWAAMSANPAQIDARFMADYFDIVWWVQAITKTAPKLADAIRYARTVTGDPTLDPQFVKKRQAIEDALGAVVRSTHGAFDRAFSLCVMSKLAGGAGNGPKFEAKWDGKTVFSNVTLAKGATG